MKHDINYYLAKIEMDEEMKNKIQETIIAFEVSPLKENLLKVMCNAIFMAGIVKGTKMAEEVLQERN